MSDNTTLNSGTGGDVVRTVAKIANSPAKTQVVILDVGGGADNAGETPWTGAVSVSNLPATQAVSAAALPLPAGAATSANQTTANTSLATIATNTTGGATAAAQTTGNASLATIATNTTGAATAANQTTGNTSLAAVSTAAGAPADAAYAGTGSSSIIAALKGIYAKLTASIAVTGTFWQATQPVSAASLPLPTGAATAALQPAINGDGGALAHVTNLPATQAVSAVALPLPSGAAQEAGNLATLVAVHGAVSDAAYAGSGSSGVIAALKGIYAKLAGTLTVTFSGSPSVTVSNASIPVTGSFFQATQPISATALPLPTGAALEAGNLATIAGSTGSTGDVAYAGSGAASLVAALKGIYAKLAATLTVSISGTPNVNVSNASIPVTGSFFQATQPVSAAALPLPAGAAQESGNLATIATAQGVGATGVTQLTGGSGLLGWLSGIYSKLSGTLATSRTWALSSGSDSVTATISNASIPVTGSFFQATQPVSLAAVPTHAVTQSGGPWTVSWSGQSVAVSSLPALPAGANAIGSVTVSNLPATQAVSAAALPLPAGAALEAGNLATIATAAGAPADAAYAGAGSTGIIAALKGIYAALKATLTVSITGTPSVSVSNASLAVTVSNFPATQAVSNASLPLPAGAATETGNLAAISGATGTAADAAYAGTGSSSLVAALKGIYGALKATLTISKPTGAANLATNQIAITASTTVATLIVAARTGGPGTGRIATLLYNFGSSTIYLGGPGVLPANGLPLLAGASIGWDTTAAIYGIAGAGGSIAYSETY